MKTKSLVLLVTMLITFSFAYAQRKSKEIDTLTQQNKELTTKLDSVNAVVAKYTVMYNVLKDSVVKYQFNPEKTAFLLDSLKNSRSAAAILLTDPDKQANDSINLLISQNTDLIKQKTELASKIDSIKTAWATEKNAVPVVSAEELENAKAITALKQLKELLDNKIISDAEFATLKKKYIGKL
jgi:hypothetical protein